MKKPIIGIVSSKEYIEKGNFKKAVYDANEDYVKLLYDFHAIPIIIPYINDFKSIEYFLKNIDGLLLIGGEDISPNCYSNGKSENKRDMFEIQLYKYFKKSKKPILGICRGLQLINVAEGGTLKNVSATDIKHYIEDDGWINYHNIKILKSSKLYNLINFEKYTISSLHHQQIEKLGKNLLVSAVADDDVIEAIEDKNENFIMAFQGHIEKCNNNFHKYNIVFKKFIKEAKNGNR